MSKIKPTPKNPKHRLASLKNELLSVPRNILVFDPGNTDTGFIWFDCQSYVIRGGGLLDNQELQHRIRINCYPSEHVVYEMPEDQGNSMDSLFETAFEAGMLVKETGLPYTKIYRHEVKLHLLGTIIGTDSDIRAALLKRYGKEKTAKVHYDAWSALALATTFADAIHRVLR